MCSIYRVPASLKLGNGVFDIVHRYQTTGFTTVVLTINNIPLEFDTLDLLTQASPYLVEEYLKNFRATNHAR